MDSFNMQKQTLLKTNPISPQSIAYLADKKRQLILIAQSKSIHLYNLSSQQFQDELKIPVGQSGSISCLTVSDDLFFFAYGMHIAAAGYNGKIVFDFDTYIASDRIERVHVIGYRLWVISGTILNQFLMAGSQLANKASRKTAGSNNKVQDIHSHMFESKINDSLAIEDQFSKHFLILLKSNNTIACYQDKELTSFKTTSPPTTIAPYQKSKARFLVGTMGGQILCLQIGKKVIKELWAIKEDSKGRVNFIMEVKNQALFVFRDQRMEVWGADRAMLAAEDTEEKYVSAVYVAEKEVIVAGAVSGNVTQLRDYTKMMKDYQKRNTQKQKQDLQKQITSLRSQYESLKSKQANKKIKPINEGITVECTISIDYQNLCSLLQLKSDCKIGKIIVKGRFQIVGCAKLAFTGREGHQESTYVIEEEDVQIAKVLFRCQERYQKEQKLKVMVYGTKDGKTYAVTRTLQLKPLLYHHKIGPVQLPYSNQLQITGTFKYFQINMIMNSIFNDFGQATETTTEVFYQSIFTKEKLAVRYQNGLCLVRSVNPAPLTVVKMALGERAKDRQMSLNYSTTVDKETVVQMVASMEKTLKPLQELKRQSELLPGLLQIQNDQTLSPDLKSILARSAQITKKQKQSSTLYESLIGQLKNMYISFQKLKEHDVTQYELDLFTRQAHNFDEEKIRALILG